MDLGASSCPIVAWAILVDLPLEAYQHYADRPGDIVHWRGSAEQLPFKDGVLDFVHASHLLEDFQEWPPLLNEWDRVLKPNGHIIIAVPDRERFRAAVAGGQGDNLNHKHESHVGELTQCLQDRYEVLRDEFVNGDPGEYSIIFVGKKKEL